MCLLAIHIYLVKLREMDVKISRTELVNLLNRARRLLAELVAGEIEDLETLTMILLIKRLQIFIL